MLIRNEELGIKNWDTELVEVATSDFETPDLDFPILGALSDFFGVLRGIGSLVFIWFDLGKPCFYLFKLCFYCITQNLEHYPSLRFYCITQNLEHYLQPATHKSSECIIHEKTWEWYDRFDTWQ